MNSPLRTRLGAFVAVAASLCTAVVSSAQETIALYTFPTSSNYSSSDTSELATASNINNAAGGSISASNLHYFKGGSPELLSSALSLNNYIGFTITPAASTTLDYGVLSFDFGSSNSTSGVDYTINWAVFSSVGGFASESNAIDSGSFSVLRNTGAGAVWVNPDPSVALNSAGLNSAAVPVEFRIYFWDNTTTVHSSLLARVDNISLTASAIPEPSTYAALIGLAALGFVALRRRQARSA